MNHVRRFQLALASLVAAVIMPSTEPAKACCGGGMGGSSAASSAAGSAAGAASNAARAAGDAAGRAARSAVDNARSSAASSSGGSGGGSKGGSSNNGDTVASQMKADAEKQQMERWKILQDTQTKIREIQQDVTINKAKTSDKAFSAFDGYIRG